MRFRAKWSCINSIQNKIITVGLYKIIIIKCIEHSSMNPEGTNRESCSNDSSCKSRGSQQPNCFCLLFGIILVSTTQQLGAAWPADSLKNIHIATEFSQPTTLSYISQKQRLFNWKAYYICMCELQCKSSMN